MPKTSVNENDLAQLWENHVRNSGKVTRMKPVSESHAVYQTADNQLWAGIRALDAGHPLTSLLPGQIIHGIGQS